MLPVGVADLLEGREVTTAKAAGYAGLTNGFVAHKTSAIKDTAEQVGVPYVAAAMSRQGLIDAFRTWMRLTAHG